MKILFWIAYGLCLIQFIIYMFFPFGGPGSILQRIKTGMYSDKYIAIFTTDHEGLYEVFSSLNSPIAVLYFSSIFFCLVIPFFKNIKPELKYKLGIACFVIVILIAIVPRLLYLSS